MIIDSTVTARWAGFNADLEGRTPYLYLTLLGVPAVGSGVMITGPDAAADDVTGHPLLDLHWRRADGSTASPVKVREEWDRVRERRDLMITGPRAFGSVTSLWLDDAELDRVLAAALDRVVTAAADRAEVADLAHWPADAQLAWCSVAFAWGPWLQAPALTDALAERDFARAAERAGLNPDVGPYFLRNQRSRSLLTAAGSSTTESSTTGMSTPDTSTFTTTTTQGS